MRRFFARFWMIAFASALAFLILRPIMGSGVWYTMHDATHPMRLALLQITALGQFPPIWADYINGGYGYPLFQFYAPLFHLMALVLGHGGLTITAALKLTLFLSIVMGICGSMLWARKWGRWAALVAGTLFAMAPYAALNIYVRGAYAEYLSMALIPWVFYTLEHLETPKRRILAALILAFFVLSHNLIPILVVPIIVVWAIYLHRKNLIPLITTGLLASGFSAWFVIPLLFERGFTVAEQVAKTTSYNLHFVEPWQLWNSTWGYGGSAAGIEDGMSFKAGKLQIIAGLLGALYALKQKNKKVIMVTIATLVLAWLATSYSAVVWSHISPLQVVQFPWRSLAVITVFLAWLGGFAVSRVPKYVRPLAGIVIIAGALILNLKYFAPQSLTTTSADSPDFDSSQIEDIATTIPEYQPKWWHRSVDPDERFDFMLPKDVVVTGGEGELQGKMPLSFKLKTTAPQPYKLTIGYAYYPTWFASIDGQGVDIQPDEIGHITLQVPEGDHAIELKQGHTELEKFAYVVTLIASAIALIYMRKSHGKK